MIDRTKRNKLAEKLRHFLSGQIDNLQFDSLDDGDFLNSEDELLWAVFHSMWYYYDDFRSHSLRITEGTRQDFIRCIVFLHTDLEFEWPSRRKGTLIRRFINALITNLVLRSHPVENGKGDMRVFPFYRSSDYEAALKAPRLLSKAA